MMTVVQFSDFHDNEENNYIVKKLAIVHIDTNSFQSWIFKSHFRFKILFLV